MFCKHRRALTLIELLVCISVIGLVTALLLPALSMARESARSVHCRNNLRQMALAMSSYESALSSLPIVAERSIHSVLLPYLEQKPIYDAINFQARLYSPATENGTVISTVVEMYLCPSRTVRHPGTSYPMSAGFDRREKRSNGPFRIGTPSLVRLEEITDGLSQTVGVSEWVLGPTESLPAFDPTSVRSRLGTIYLTSPGLTSPETLGRFLIECRLIDTNKASIGHNSKGSEWLTSGYLATNFNHNLEIGSPSCFSDGQIFPGAYSAASEHGNGAHAAFLDGHVQYFKSTTPLAVWRALGTINGGETIVSE